MPTPSEHLRAGRLAVLRRTDLTGAALRRALVDTTDAWLAERISDRTDVAIVAVGGYGRCEPSPGSDLDLVLLHRDSDDVRQLAEEVWYPIWDAGVKLDHSVRTVAQARAVARQDLKAVLGLLDARHVCGDAGLTEELRSSVLADWRRDARRRLPELYDTTTARWQANGELAFLLEPDLKEARGGLRDVHALTAVAAAWVADPPGPRVRSAATLLLDVRGELHRRQSRPNDRLVLQEQEPVATALGCADTETLMRGISSAARTIAFVADDTWRRVQAAARPPRRWRQRPVPRRPLADGVVEQDGVVVLARDAEPARDPTLLVRVAAAAALADLPIAGHTLDRIAAESPPLPTPWPPGAREAFVALLGAGRPAVRAVETLDQHGLFERLLPEWQAVRCKPQRNPVHRFTVDRHLVEAAVEAAELTRRVSRPDLLLVAALLHDIGKGWPGDHTEAGLEVVPAVVARMGFDADDVAVVTSLVRHHLLLPDTATRRDLDDPATVRAVADAVTDTGTLELLHALTEADARATGPAAWGEWKAGLVEDLVRRTAVSLAGWAQPVTEVLDDSQRAMVAAGGLGLDVADARDGHRVTVVAPDRPGLLWRWAGVLALHRLTILTATACSADAMAVTVFHVAPRFGSPPDWDAVRADVHRAYDDALPLTAHLADRERSYRGSGVPAVPPRVLWFDDASDSATVIEVRARDTVGLLYRLTRALAEADLDVRAARLSTFGADVVDAFYVVDADGGRVAAGERRCAIETALLTACRGAD